MHATDPTDAAQAMLRLWHRVLSDARPLYVLMKELDIALTDMKILHHLSVMPVDPTVKDLAEEMGMSLPGASRAADALLRRGFLERREDETDRRMKRLAITDEGRSTIRRIEDARLAGVEELLARVPEDVRARLTAAIVATLDHLEGEQA